MCEVFSNFLFPPFPTLCFPLCISVMGACLLGVLGLMAGLSGFASHQWSWLPIVEAPGCLGHLTSHIVTQLFISINAPERIRGRHLI